MIEETPSVARIWAERLWSDSVRAYPIVGGSLEWKDLVHELGGNTGKRERNQPGGLELAGQCCEPV